MERTYNFVTYFRRIVRNPFTIFSYLINYNQSVTLNIKLKRIYKHSSQPATIIISIEHLLIGRADPSLGLQLDDLLEVVALHGH